MYGSEKVNKCLLALQSDIHDINGQRRTVVINFAIIPAVAVFILISARSTLGGGGGAVTLLKYKR